MTKLDKDALAKLLQGRRIAAVSGTNGKTTTTHLLAAAVRAGLGADTQRLVTNADGANLHYGIASALSTAPYADLAVLETDERVVADVIRLGKPEVLVLLNFSRDQLDRHHEIKSLARSWRTALEAAGADGPVVIANSQEPMIVWAAQTAKRVVWVETRSVWAQDSALCPACGSELRGHDAPGEQTAQRWHCTGCDLAEPEPAWSVSGDTIIDPEGTVWEPKLQVPGAFNVSNAALAMAAAAELGVPAGTAIRGMRKVTAPAGRFATTTIGDTTVRLLLAKNPAGWAEALPIINTDTVVLAIDSVAADGRDVSWLWDVDFEQLAGKNVIAAGPRALDLAVRLSYAEVDFTVKQDLAEALAGHPNPVDVLATYTPFQKLRKMGGLA
ncbi:Mur ligase family protein [Granulicoccus phenolivorans]|uniref:Mur ligase family protein n=1 Tax=Granulicoccus phenolivorans TaxID=266854 RepID=UPI001FDF2856|nr:MurT ligase domain-containing protein [Granulicoccus phenolivorans]